MGDVAFVSADIGKIAEFERKSEEVVAEFNAITLKFTEVQKSLLEKWKGEGADDYKRDSNNIFKNIEDIESVLDTINNGVVKDIKDVYMQLDEALGEFNRNPMAEE